ncbi:hypothetical protein CH063_09179, partial [Colletotrichum higginsianum]
QIAILALSRPHQFHQPSNSTVHRTVTVTVAAHLSLSRSRSFLPLPLFPLGLLVVPWLAHLETRPRKPKTRTLTPAFSLPAQKRKKKRKKKSPGAARASAAIHRTQSYQTTTPTTAFSSRTSVLPGRRRRLSSVHPHPSSSVPAPFLSPFPSTFLSRSLSFSLSLSLSRAYSINPFHSFIPDDIEA